MVGIKDSRSLLLHSGPGILRLLRRRHRRRSHVPQPRHQVRIRMPCTPPTCCRSEAAASKLDSSQAAGNAACNVCMMSQQQCSHAVRGACDAHHLACIAIYRRSLRVWHKPRALMASMGLHRKFQMMRARV